MPAPLDGRSFMRDAADWARLCGELAYADLFDELAALLADHDVATVRDMLRRGWLEETRRRREESHR